MLHYTKQQLTGAGRYSPHVHIGNWNEELKLNEEKIKSLRLRQQQGSLELNRWGVADDQDARCASVLLNGAVPGALEQSMQGAGASSTTC